MSKGQLATVLQQLRNLIGGRSASDQADGDLLGRFVERQDQAAFAALVQRHGPMVLSQCRRILSDGHDAEDAFQGTFLVLARKAASLDRRLPLANWLYGVAQRVALKARAHTARRQRLETQVATMAHEPATNEVHWDDLRPLLDAEVSRLPAKYRQPVVLCYFQGCTNEEAARQLGWPEGSVKGRLARARELLRGRLAGKGLSLSAALLGSLLAQNGTAASLPLALVETTTETAFLFSSHTAGLGTPALYAEGVLHAMLVSKLKFVTSVLLAASVLVAVGSFLVHQALAERSEATVDAFVPVTPDNESPRPTAPVQFLSMPRVWTRTLDRRIVRPLLTVACVPFRQEGDVLQSIQGNTALLLAPQTGVQTALLLTTASAPGHESTPFAITRQGNTFTLDVRTWKDSAAKPVDAVGQRLDLIPLSNLDAGEYELQLNWQELAWNAPRPQRWYELSARKTARLRFKVAKADAPERDLTTVPTLQVQDLKATEIPAADRNLFWQQPSKAVVYLHLETPLPQLRENPGLEPGLRVGSLDLKKWQDSKPQKLADLPQLQPATAQDAVYATVLGPAVNIGEWMTLRDVVWQDREATLKIDLWRDDEPRKSNIPTNPLQVVRLELPRQPGNANLTASGEYKVRVVWTFLRAANNRQPYVLEDPTSPQVASVLQALQGRSQVAFTIK